MSDAADPVLPPPADAAGSAPASPEASVEVTAELSTEVTAEVSIEKLVYGGDGLARWPGGKAAFVPFTLPGERVRAEREGEKPGFVRARAAEILSAAPERVAPECEYFFRCGGCQLQHAAAARQLELKREVLRETLARTGGLAWPGEIALHASPPWGYRNRVRLRWGPPGPGHDALGYYARESHAVIGVGHCPIASPALNAAMGALAAVPPPAAAHEIELAADDEDQAILAAVAFARLGTGERAFAAGLMERIPGCVSVAAGLAGRAEAPNAALRPGKVVAGPGSFLYKVGDRGYRVSHGAFFQVNRFLLLELVAAVTSGSDGAALEGERAVDLFSGVGLFALPLAARFAEVSAVENAPAAAADLRFNAAACHARVYGEDAAAVLARWRGPLDLLLVDPPRTGLGPKLVAAVAAAAPQRLHYLSCDPATLARDLRALLAAMPVAVESIELFDLFPQTYHLETLVRLRPMP
ncbi:MAG: class I SAM-dependent RNA methyltransferase [Terriglobales bacterium]